MNLLDTPVLFTLELHITAAGPSRYWLTPRDVRELSPADRVYIGQHLEAQFDRILGELGLTRRYEVTSRPLTGDEAKAVLG